MGLLDFLFGNSRKRPKDSDWRDQLEDYTEFPPDVDDHWTVDRVYEEDRDEDWEEEQEKDWGDDWGEF